GDTAAEMANALRFAGYESEIHAAMASLQDRFNSAGHDAGPQRSGAMAYLRDLFSSAPSAGALETANRLWLDKREKLTSDFEALTGEYYEAGVAAADFFAAPESARVEINDWVARKTRDKIKNLLDKSNVTSDTKLILVNAIYFNSAWLEPFKKTLTRDEPFRTGRGEQHDVPMMRREARFLYGENSDAQWIKIPYEIPGFYLMIILPRENETFTQLEELENMLSHDALASWTAGMNFAQVALRMPKFKDERRYSLADILKKLGMNLAFTDDADFSGMVEPREDGYPVRIDFVIHQAFIELDEERTEAAASTAVGMTATSAAPGNPERIIEFNADHPFIYCLTDDQTGVILFMGRMADPR
ncbi:MAG: serpin family protein, partial [Synergistaceae bacterium]|nr:serpin family protein [Synergistaceae bacterium]